MLDMLSGPSDGRDRSPQGLFNDAYLGVIRQGGPSKKGSGACCYLSPNGDRCGVGHLVDDATAIEWDGKLNSGIRAIIRSIPPDDPDAEWLMASRDLLSDIQEAHDSSVDRTIDERELADAAFITNFRWNMVNLASVYGLTVPADTAVTALAAA